MLTEVGLMSYTALQQCLHDLVLSLNLNLQTNARCSKMRLAGVIFAARFLFKHVTWTLDSQETDLDLLL